MNTCSAHVVRSGIRNEARGGGANIEALAYSASQCGLTMRSEWPDRSENEKLETRPNAQEQAIVEEQEPKRGPRTPLVVFGG